MKKWLLILFILIGLAGCNEEKLVRVDLQKGENRTGEHIITDVNQLKSIEEVFRQVKWENAKVQMSRKEDMMLTFFYQYNSNEPEWLEGYKIWLNKDKSIEIVNPNGNKYGELKEAEAQILMESVK
jgi:hypothetical protein